ncbi:hypothetical protein PQ610_00310 [Tardisphaera miroshnichenkoae]
MDEATRKVLMEVREDIEKIREEVLRGQSMSYFDPNELLSIAFDITNLVNNAASKLDSLLNQEQKDNP